jgi:hypothetical protein
MLCHLYFLPSRVVLILTTKNLIGKASNRKGCGYQKKKSSEQENLRYLTFRLLEFNELISGNCVTKCSTLKIQILKIFQTRPKFKMNFNFLFKNVFCELISINKI